MIVNEGLIDKRIEQAVLYASKSQTYAKYTALATGRVGDYSGATQQIIDQTGASSSTVYNWANAYKLYNICRRQKCKLSRMLWRELRLSFWWSAWGIHAAGYDALDYLRMAYDNRMSVRDMMEEFKRDREAGLARLRKQPALDSVRSLAADIIRLYSNEISEGLKVALLGVLDELEAKDEAV